MATSKNLLKILSIRIEGKIAAEKISNLMNNNNDIKMDTAQLKHIF